MTNLKFQLERTQNSPVSTDEIVSDIRSVAERSGATIISMKLYSELGKYSAGTAARRFGTWNKAIIAAGLDVANELNISDERLFENLMHVWEHFGRQPRRRELSHAPSLISEGPYVRRFHTWSDALKQFVDFANALETQLPFPKEVTRGHHTPRDPSLRLRFRVMKRDNFSCCTCGASPALKPGLLLHLDHIEPWSKGGETIEDNLQTLCKACNLGKSNVL